MRKRVIVLLRVSTDAQDLARQRTDVKRVIALYGLEVIRIVELDGVSGRSVQADPQFQAIVRDLARADVDGVVISALDRLFRPDLYADFAILDHFKRNQKLIYSAKEGVLDPSTDAGFMMSLMSGAQAGMEWRELRRRTMQGKEEKRREGKHVNGGQSLPRGVHYDKATGKWSYQEPDCSRVKRMFQLFDDGHSLREIAEAVGGGWTHQGVRHTLRHRIWGFGEAVWSANAHREEPLIRKVIEPLVSPEIWQRVNDNLAARTKRWHTRRPTRFLLSGLIRCSCGKPCYLRTGSRNSSHDTYLCSTRYRSGPGCGMRRVWRERVDDAVIRIVREQFQNPNVRLLLVDALEKRQIGAPARSQDTARERGRLEKKRERIVELRVIGHITLDECTERLGAVDRELAGLRVETPAEHPQIDTVRLATALQAYFAGFEKWPLERQRKLLRWAVGDVVLNRNGIDTMSLKGSFLVVAA